MAEKEQPKEKSKEEKARDIAMKNLDSALWKYAAPKLITFEQYGKLSDASQSFYDEIIKKTPDQSIYEQLFYPQLANESGAITSPYIQNTSAKILIESIGSLKVSDLSKYGYKGAIKESYKDKYVHQLDEKEAGMIIGSVMTMKTDGVVKEILDLRQKEISKGLESILAEKEKKE